MQYYQLTPYLDVRPSQFYLLNHLEPLQEYTGKCYSIKMFFCGFDVSLGQCPQPTPFEIQICNRRTMKIVIDYVAATYEAAYKAFVAGVENIQTEEGR